MSNLNKVLIMGRLTRDPEVRYTPQGVPVSEIGLAINREYTFNNERRKETTFVDVTLWRRHAELVAQYLKKGAPLFIEGRLVQDSWETADGQKRTKLKVVADNFQFLGARSEGQASGGYEGGEGAGPPEGGSRQGGYRRDSYPSEGPPRQGYRSGPASPGGQAPPAATPPDAPGEAEETTGLGVDDSEIPF